MTRLHARILGVVLGAIAIGGWARYEQLRLQPASQLWVEGTSTVRGFTCKAGVLDAVIETSRQGAVTAVLGGENGVQSVSGTEAVVSVRSVFMSPLYRWGVTGQVTR